MSRPSFANLTWPDLSRTPWLERTAGGCWLAVIAVVTVMVLISNTHTVTPFYHDAALAWWAGRDIYAHQLDSFHYLPAFSVLFTPFALMGRLAGDLVWRWLCFAALTASCWRLARLGQPRDVRRLLTLMLPLAIPGAAAMIRNGQATAMLIAVMIFAVADIAESRWSRATLWLGLGLALKPLVIVLALLCVALHRPLRWRLTIAVAIVLLAPLLHPDPGYALAAYRSAFSQLAISVKPGVGRWADIGMMLHKLGLAVPDGILTAIRAAAALATLALARLTVRRHPPDTAAINLLTLSVCYLMLFNPISEQNTY